MKLFKIYDKRNYFKNEYLEDNEDPLMYWQSRIFGTISNILIISATPLLLFGAWMFFLEGQYTFSFLEILSAGSIFFILRAKKIDLALKKLLAVFMTYLIGVMLLVAAGPKGAGMVCITFSLVSSGCILSKKHVVRAVLFNLGVFLLLTLFLFSGVLDHLMIVEYKSSWFINVGVVQVCGIGLLMIMSTIYAGLENQTKWVRQSKKELMVSEARHLNMMSNISDVITIVDREGIIKYQSPNVEKLFGWHPKDVEGQSYKHFVHPEDIDFMIENVYRVLKHTREPLTYECRYKLKSGEYSHIELFAINQFDNPNIGGLLVHYHDISERKASETALLLAKEASEMANVAKSKFLSVMSHEIRTPLNGMMGMIQLMEMTEVTSEQKDYLKSATAASESLMMIINDILDVTKIEAEMIKLEWVSFNIREMIFSIKQLFLASSMEKGLKINTYVHDDVPKYLVGDVFRLRQVLSNLINNALKFTSEGSIDLTIEIDSCDVDGMLIKWSVKDTGSGIKEEHLKTIFESFNQGEDSTARYYGGSGLGLSICKGLVDLMGGELFVESEEGSGSRFIFTSPLKNDSMTTETNDKTPHFSEVLKVLIAEDDEISRSILMTYGQKKGWKVTVAVNGEEAVKHYDETFDIVFMDIQMPHLDGYHATQYMRMKSKRRVPIIAMTAFALSSEREKCYSYDMDDYLSKPINMDMLEKMVIKWVR